MRFKFANLLSVSTVVLASMPGTTRAQQIVGAVGAANALPTGRAPGRAARTLAPGADIFFKDRISTKRGGSAQLTFLDRSTLSIGENSDLIVDEFVYHPGAGGTMSATLGKGVLRFVGGDISHNGGATVKTPVVTIGIRGGIGTIGYLKEAADLATIPGVPAGFRGGTVVVNGYGRITVRNGVSEVVLTRPGFAVFVGSTSAAIAAPVRFDPAAMRALVAAMTSKGSQRGGATGKGTVTVASLGRLVDVPVAVPRPPSIDALDVTSIFSAGNALARNQAQAHQASLLLGQIQVAAPVTIAAAPAAAASKPVVALGTATASEPVAASTVVTNTTGASTPVIAATTASIPAAFEAAKPPAVSGTAEASPAARIPLATPAATTPTAAPAASQKAATPAASTPAASTPAAAPAASPQATAPAASPKATTPAATTPAASAPATASAAASTSSGASGGSKAVTIPTQTVYDINVAVVSASVIYAHTIDAGTITANKIVYGTTYGSTSGSTVNGNSYTTSGQLNAHDIHAGTVIANTIYVDNIDR